MNNFIGKRHHWMDTRDGVSRSLARMLAFGGLFAKISESSCTKPTKIRANTTVQSEALRMSCFGRDGRFLTLRARVEGWLTRSNAARRAEQ